MSSKVYLPEQFWWFFKSFELDKNPENLLFPGINLLFFFFLTLLLTFLLLFFFLLALERGLYCVRFYETSMRNYWGVCLSWWRRWELRQSVKLFKGDVIDSERLDVWGRWSYSLEKESEDERRVKVEVGEEVKTARVRFWRMRVCIYWCEARSL